MKAWLQRQRERFWQFWFHWLHRRWLTVYEKRIKPTHELPEDYVSTSIVTDPISGRILQVDVFSTETSFEKHLERQEMLSGRGKYADNGLESGQEADEKEILMFPIDTIESD